ncbi:MAG: hypothetical protein GX597_22465 [Anaerolineaceae bacterium]|nr:hypothetical protein [Anaerolineaceae bacterium]
MAVETGMLWQLLVVGLPEQEVPEDEQEVLRRMWEQEQAAARPVAEPPAVLFRPNSGRRRVSYSYD